MSGPAAACIASAVPGAVTNARLPGGPNIGMYLGGLPSSADTVSRSAATVSRVEGTGPSRRKPISVDVTMSTEPTTEIAAAIRWSSTATVITCPPDNDMPQSTILSGSTLGRPRAWATAARKSSSWRLGLTS